MVLCIEYAIARGGIEVKRATTCHHSAVYLKFGESVVQETLILSGVNDINK